jgi:DNA topoisomerase-1
MPGRAAVPTVADLFVIEAPGKRQRLGKILEVLGWAEPLIVATCGHFVGMPQSLSPLGIDARLHEVARAVTRPRSVEMLDAGIDEAVRRAQATSTRPRVWVMTDADAEGAAIGLDAANLVSSCLAGSLAEPERPLLLMAPLKAMTTEAVARALACARPMGPETAVAAMPARGRAVVDRVIGGVFSRSGVAVGRIASAILGALDAEGCPIGEVVLEAPAAAGGRPFRARLPVRTPEEAAAWRARLDRLDHEAGTFPPLAAQPAQEPWRPLPFTMPEILIEASAALGMAARDTERTLQALYEDGRLSYPRSSSRELSAEAMANVQKSAARSGVRGLDPAFDPDAGVPGAEPAWSVHEAVHPLEPVLLTGRLAALEPAEAVLTLIGRRLVEARLPTSLQLPTRASLEVLPVWARELPWQRLERRRLPWDGDSRVRPGLRLYGPEELVLRTMVAHGLGTPATMAGHAARFVERGLHADGRLTREGRRWLQATPAWALDPTTSRRIEERLAASRQQAGPSEDVVPPASPLASDILANSDTPACQRLWAKAAVVALKELPGAAQAELAAVIRREAGVVKAWRQDAPAIGAIIPVDIGKAEVVPDKRETERGRRDDVPAAALGASRR